MPRPELATLEAWWREGGGGLCALVGADGSGKSSLAGRFLARLEDVPQSGAPAPLPVLVFSLAAGDPDNLFATLYDWLRPSQRRSVGAESARSLYGRLVRRLARSPGRRLLILDGVETVQRNGHLEDPRLRDLLGRLAEAPPGDLATVLTCRQPLADLALLRTDAAARWQEIEVGALPTAAAVEFLVARGLVASRPILERLAGACGHHAFTLDLAAAFLLQFHGGDPSADLGLPAVAAAQRQARPLQAGDPSLRLSRLLHCIRASLARRDPAALALFERLCLFPQGVDATTLAALFLRRGLFDRSKRKLAGRRLAALSRRGLAARLGRLTALRLAAPVDASGRLRVPEAVRAAMLGGLDSVGGRGHGAAAAQREGALGPAAGSDPTDRASLDQIEAIIAHLVAVGETGRALMLYRERAGGFTHLGQQLGAYGRGERLCRLLVNGRAARLAPLPRGVPRQEKALFLHDWALYLHHLGSLDAASACYERAIDMWLSLGAWQRAARGMSNLADLYLLAGRLPLGLRASEEARSLAERADDAAERLRAFAASAHAHALRGDVHAALGHFRAALAWRALAGAEIEWPLYSNRGIHHTLLLARLAEPAVAARLRRANVRVMADGMLKPRPERGKGHFVLADLARSRDDYAKARALLQRARVWSLDRDGREPYCWAGMIAARIAVREAAGRAGASGERPFAVARTVLAEGIRQARAGGFAIYHADLMVLQARMDLATGDAEGAERAARTALFGRAATAADRVYDEGAPPARRGILPPRGAAVPAVLAATHPECGYAWGEADGRAALGEALLLRAARQLRLATLPPAAHGSLSNEVAALIHRGRSELVSSRTLRGTMHDPAALDINRRLAALDRGELTSYPLGLQ